MSTNLSGKALIACLHIRCWTGTMTDQNVSREIERTKKAEKGTGSFAKNLLNKKTLSPMGAVAQRIRDRHHYLTLPWNDAGDRLLPISAHARYKRELSDLIDEFVDARAEFLSHYSEYVRVEKTRLGDMYDEKEYPDFEEIKGKFEVSLGYTTVPDARHFVADMADAEQMRLRNEIEQEIESRVKSANTDLYYRLRDAVDKMVVRLAPKDDGKPSAIRDAALSNLQTLLETIQSLNLTDNTLITKICGEINGVIDGVEASELRENSSNFKVEKYTQVRDKMELLKEQFSGYFGEPTDLPTLTEQPSEPAVQ